jgi:hypothetical protein
MAFLGRKGCAASAAKEKSHDAHSNLLESKSTRRTLAAKQTNHAAWVMMMISGFY